MKDSDDSGNGKRRPVIKLKDWDAAEHLQTAEDQQAYLDVVLAGGDPEDIAIALANIARARETRSAHVTPVGGNVFVDIGFPPDEAATLKAESDRIIRAKLAAQSRTEDVALSAGRKIGRRRLDRS